MELTRKTGVIVCAAIVLFLGSYAGAPRILAAEPVSALPQEVRKMLEQQGVKASLPPHGVPIGKANDMQPDSAAEDSAPKRAEAEDGAGKRTEVEGGEVKRTEEKPGLHPGQQPPALSPAPTAASSVESSYRSSYSSPLASQLAQFGYGIFASAQAKSTRLAVPADDYRIGPGDKLRVRVWGSGVDSEYVGVVEKNGTINVPQIGIVDIADVTYGQVEQVIRKESEKYIQGANINVTLVDLRSVEVYVVGSVSSPSLHLIPAFSTVFDGVLAAGGISREGSLRRIELYRDGALFKRFDLYDLLLYGKRDADLVLQNRDVIFVPRLGKTVAVAGAVREPAIFELNGEKTASDCLALAGGILPQGYGGKMLLRRYENNQEFVVREINNERDAMAQATAVKDGDLIELAFLPEKMPQIVRLDGNVWQPEVFQYKPAMMLSDVLTSYSILKPGAVTDFAILHRYDATTTRYTPQRIPLNEALQGKFSLPLQPYDRIEILSREALGITENITVSGAVWQPGIKPYSPGLTLGGVLALAGGSRFGALLSGIEVSRQVISKGEAVSTIFNLDADKDTGFIILPNDFIAIKEVKEANSTHTVHIKGEVRFPGDYKLADGERLSSLIERAGGFMPNAYYFGAKFTSQRAMAVQQKSIDDMISRLDLHSKQDFGADVQNSKEAASALALAQAAREKALQTLKAVKAEGRVAIQLAEQATFVGSAYDFVLEDGDTLDIPKQPNFVSVLGSVYAPNSFHYEPNRTVEYYIKKSGGGTKEADVDSVYLLRANGEVFSKAQHGGMLSWSSFESLVLMPGDTIVVPVDFERVPYLGLVKDIADIVFKIATTAGVAIAVL